MKIGIAINDTWSFFNEIYNLIKSSHQTTLFSPQKSNFPLFNTRINRKYYRSQLNRFLSSNDVVFFEWAGEYLAHATALPKQCGIVARLHRYELYQWAEHINWEKVDRLILVSQAKEGEALTSFQELNGKTLVISEGIDLQKFPFSPQPFRKQLGILCHLTPRKRVYELMIAFSEYNLAKDGYILHIGGGEHPKFKDYYQSIKALISNLDLENSIKMHGHVTNSLEWFANIDIFISNSYSEGLQISPMEAMACGCYCLSHAWPGSNELLPADNLFLTNAQLNTKIRSFAALSETEQLDQKKKLRTIVENKFDIQIVGEKILREIESVGNKFV